MKRILTNELAAHAGERVLLQGWLHRRRDLSRVSFLVLRDRAGLAQVVLERGARAVAGDRPRDRGRSPSRTSRRPAGWRSTNRVIRVLAEPAAAPPVELHRPEPRESLPMRLDAAPVALRHPVVRERFRLAARAVAAFRSTLDAARLHRDPDAEDRRDRDRGRRQPLPRRLLRTGRVPRAEPAVLQADAGRACSSASTRSGRCSEPSRTRRDGISPSTCRSTPSSASSDDHRDVMDVVRTVVVAMIEAVGERAPDEVPVVRFEDVRTGDEPDLSPADERRICAEHGELVFVEGFPTWKRPFYTHPDPERPEWSRGFDLLYRGLEIVTGGQRLHRYEDYRRGARGARHGRGAFRVVPRRVPLRDAAARRLRPRPRALRGPGGRRLERPRDDALPA